MRLLTTYDPSCMMTLEAIAVTEAQIQAEDPVRTVREEPVPQHRSWKEARSTYNWLGFANAVLPLTWVVATSYLSLPDDASLVDLVQGVGAVGCARFLIGWGFVARWWPWVRSGFRELDTMMIQHGYTDPDALPRRLLRHGTNIASNSLYTTFEFFSYLALGSPAPLLNVALSVNSLFTTHLYLEGDAKGRPLEQWLKEEWESTRPMRTREGLRVMLSKGSLGCAAARFSQYTGFIR